MKNAIEIAERFAQALDSEDYESAQELLSEACEYSCRGQSHVGPTAIIASYKGNGDTADSKFDSVDYESSVSDMPDGTALITFVDHFALKGKSHTFRCEQVLEVDNNGQITRIVHRDLPGQREALTEFMGV
ncbi:SnoaL-like domain protein [Aeoliella mucimassa]|uniref:SnoaL-like domain protein n=2 Tax=Aeoliella mucimassa TaxID=2527972 RepID=A0A518AVI4_9BACT|nr:SnoaL-like domain protein [Aeoliella mucimassa]